MSVSDLIAINDVECQGLIDLTFFEEIIDVSEDSVSDIGNDDN